MPAPSPSVISAHMVGGTVLLDIDSKSYFHLNETGGFIWKRLERGGTVADMVDAICGEFDVDAVDAAAEVTRILDELEAAGLVSR